MLSQQRKKMAFWEVKSVTIPKETQDCSIIGQTFTIQNMFLLLISKFTEEVEAAKISGKC